VFSWMYHQYFEVTVSGIEHVPGSGRGMLVGNHSGGWALDGVMVMSSVFYEMEPPRLAQGMIDRFINRLPFASLYASRTGNFTGSPESAVELLDAERLLMVFPEGARGTAKLYGDRNRLLGFGSGFMRLAIETRTPIIPFAFLGGGDAVPTVLNLYRLGKFLGVPYIPLTPYILPVPRRVPLEVYYGEPMFFDGTGDEDDRVITDYVEQVRERIATMMQDGERARKEREVPA
jgi:1-acyl-sn-glycerol-3-phosphate acyltransferase